MKKYSIYILIIAIFIVSTSRQTNAASESKLASILEELNTAADQTKTAITQPTLANPESIKNFKDLYNQFINNARYQRDYFDQQANDIIIEGLNTLASFDTQLNEALAANNIPAKVNLVDNAYKTLAQYSKFLSNQISDTIKKTEEEPIIEDDQGQLISLKTAFQREQASRIKPIPLSKDRKVAALSGLKKARSLSREFLSIIKRDAVSKSKELWESAKEAAIEAAQQAAQEAANIAGEALSEQTERAFDKILLGF